MFQTIRSIVDYRELLFIITWRDIRIKYKQSIMGFMWAIFMPMIIVAAGIVVKVAFSYFSKEPLALADVVTISVKALPWSLFVSSLQFASNSLVSNQNLVTKIYFPRQALPIAAMLARLADFFVSAVGYELYCQLLERAVRKRAGEVHRQRDRLALPLRMQQRGVQKDRAGYAAKRSDHVGVGRAGGAGETMFSDGSELDPGVEIVLHAAPGKRAGSKPRHPNLLRRMKAPAAFFRAAARSALCRNAASIQPATGIICRFGRPSSARAGRSAPG